MQNVIASADGVAMPERLSTRRAALTAILGAGALAVGLGATSPAGAAGVDAPLFDLIERWLCANDRAEAADCRFADVNEAVFFEPPTALVRTVEDQDLFLDRRPVGMPYGTEQDIAVMEHAFTCLAGFMPYRLGYGAESRLPRMASRAQEIMTAYRDHEAAVEAAKKANNFYELEAEFDAAREAKMALRTELAEARPRTVPGLLAKLAAIADAYSRVTLDEETELVVGEIPSFDKLALFVLRDSAAIL